LDDRPPSNTYESNFIHDDFVQFGKQHLRRMVNFTTIVSSQQCYEVYFITLAEAKPCWALTAKYY